MAAEDEDIVNHGPELANDDSMGVDAQVAGSAATGRAAPMEGSKISRGGWHANTEISANTTANVKYLYYYCTKGEDRNVASIRRKQTDDPIDEVR